MTEPTPHQDEAPEQISSSGNATSGKRPPKKRRRGCWISFGVLILLAATAVYIIYFTAIPARFLLSRASKDKGFEAEGVSGSLASGRSAVNKFSFDTGAETPSEIRGFEINYPTFGPYDEGKFVIERLIVESATLYFDSQNLGPRKKDENEDPPQETADKPKEERQKSNFKGFRLKKLEAANVTLHVVDLNWHLEFSEGLTLSDIEGGKGGMSVGGLSLVGDAMQLEILPFKSSPPNSDQPTTVAATLDFTPLLSPTVLQKIHLDIALHFLKEKLTTTEIAAFGSAFKTNSIPDSDGLWALSANALTVGDYVSGWFPGRDITIEATYHNESGKWQSLTTGKFTLGSHTFAFTPFEDSATDTLHATTEFDGTTITLDILFADGFAAPTLTFTSEPALPESEIRSLLALPDPDPTSPEASFPSP